MENVRMPIQTIREGNKITKTCVEDVYKMVNRIQDAMNKAYNGSVDIIDSLQKDEYGDNCAVVFGTGISQPCLSDAFDEEIGNNIAFMKMKLNANIKKAKILKRILNQYDKLYDSILEEVDKIDELIEFDLEGIRRHNPDYLIGKF